MAKGVFSLIPGDIGAIDIPQTWVRENNICVLNVAGPRESHSPGIYNMDRVLLEDVIS